MNDFQLCENGHYYPNTLDECPYCPKNSDSDDMDLSQTQIFSSKSNLSKTQVFSGNSSFNSSQFNFQEVRPSHGRKLVGWLVSFTLDANGMDYKLFEGRNLIGSDQACDIVIPDPAVSGKHLTILHRMGHFKFKDEFSTNGTFINDVFEEEGNLKDGDLIKIGETIFKFRSIA